MKDPFPVAPPEYLIKAVQPLADSLSLPTLALHAHEVIFAFLLYSFLGAVAAPAFSKLIWPKRYAQFNRRTRVNWNVHIVSFFQSVLISAMSLYVIFFDEERKSIRSRAKWDERLWEYTGANGLCQSFALGYFLWDLIICTYHVQIFGGGMLAHAISAVSVFALGYRPFVYFYAPIFLLYELSSPFLNIHWFCDKLDLTGSTVQAVNGAFLTATFFGCRLVWGNISSVSVFYDIFKSVSKGHGDLTLVDTGAPTYYSASELLRIYGDEQGQRLAFAGGQHIPIWLALVYLASNLTLNSLNIFWFGKMIQTIRKRFDPPWGTKGVGSDIIHWEPQEKAKAKEQGSVKAARQKAESALNGTAKIDETTQVQKVTLANGTKSIEVNDQRTLRTRRKA